MFRLRTIKRMYFLIQQSSLISYLTVKETLHIKPVGNKILVQGWVQAIRKHKDTYFVDLYDGTCLERLQIIIKPDGNMCPTYASSIKVEGSLIKSSHKGQEVELVAEKWSTLGSCPPDDYPFKYHQKYSNEYIRQYPHLRARTRINSSIRRVGSEAHWAVHDFFRNEGFHFIDVPILTRNDCEGAGEVFSVQLKQTSKSTVRTDMHNSSENEKKNVEQVHEVSRNVETEEFFGDKVHLTVSGQLHLESMASALSRVYTIGPVFRAESSHTRQHASEFRMIEAEIAFIENIGDLMRIPEKCIKFVGKSILDNCYPEIKFLCDRLNIKEEYLKNIILKPFEVISYNEAIKILEENKDKLKVPLRGDDDFPTEHKYFLVNYCNSPVFITMFPSKLKPFYMKKDENTKEAYCFDLFASFGGEICGGSLRESDEQILKTHPVLENSSLSWYLDLRKYGTVPHGGFGIGFERLLQCLLGISNIRDIISFPRRKNDCKC